MKKDNYSQWDVLPTGKDEHSIRKQKGFESYQKVIKFAQENPNDSDLGKKVREFILSTSVQQN